LTKLYNTARKKENHTEEVKRLTVLAEITAVACGVEKTGFISLGRWQIMSDDLISCWLMVGKNTFMCPVCKAQITGNENIKYQRYCYWCGTKMTQDKVEDNE
jgi:hypothetical protein